MLEAVLALDSPIHAITVLNPEIMGSVPADRLIVLDIRLRLDNGCEVDVEMQCRNVPGLKSRLLFYCCRLHAGDLRRGEDFTRVHPTVSIVWMGESLLAGQQFHSVFHLAEDTTHERFSDDVEIHVLELPTKLGALASDRSTSLYRWARFLIARDDAELDAIAQEDPIMAETKSTLDALSAQPDIQALARERELALDHYWYSLGAARNEGRAEGELIGRAEGIIAVLEARGLPLSTEQRLRIEQISDLGELDRMVRKAATVSMVDALFEH